MRNKNLYCFLKNKCLMYVFTQLKKTLLQLFYGAKEGLIRNTSKKFLVETLQSGREEGTALWLYQLTALDWKVGEGYAGIEM